MRIACCPFASGPDMEENLRHIRAGIRTAAENGARLACFHECALTGYPPIESRIENIHAEACAAGIRAVQEMAREHGLFVLLGTVMYVGSKRHNSALVLDDTGTAICRYDKQALWGWDEETFAPGNGGGIFTIDGVKIGIRICFDVRFPELFRPLFAQGADLCVLPFSDTAQTPDPERRAILTGHLRTRAAENVMQIISVNSLSRHPTVPTAWFDQNGRLLREAEGKEILLCDVTVPKEDFGMRGRRINAQKFLSREK